MTVETQDIIAVMKFEAEQAERRAKSMERQIDALERRFDPLGKATQRYNRDLANLDRALAAGVVDQERHSRLLKNATLQYEEAAAAVNKLNVAQGHGGFLRANRNAFQQIGYQVGDFAVQVQGGTSALTAFTQQGSQMLGVFGAYGAIAGAALAIGAPLIASFIDSGEAAEDYAEGLKKLEAALRDYEAAADRASQADLTEEFGEQGEALRDTLELLAEVAQQDAINALNQSIRGFKDEFGELFSSVGEARPGSSERTQITALKKDFGIARAEAEALRRALDDIALANGPEQVRDTASQLLALLTQIFGETENIPEEFQAMAKAAAEAKVTASQLVNVGEEMEETFSQGADEVARVEENLKRATAAIQALSSAANSVNMGTIGLEAQNSVLERGGDRFEASAAGRIAQERARLAPALNASEAEIRQAAEAELDAYTAAIERNTQAQQRNLELTKERGGSRRGGGRGADQSLSTGRQIQTLQRELELIGKSEAQIAALRTEWALLDEAKRKNIPVTDELRQKISDEAAEVGNLTLQVMEAQDEMQALEAVNAAFKDSIIDAATGAEGAFDNLTASIKRAAAEYLLFGEGPLSGLFGGSFGGVLGALTSTPSVSARSDPLASVPVIATPKPDRPIGGSAMAINVNVSGARGNAEVEKMVETGVTRGLAQYDRALPDKIASYNSDPAKRY